MLFLNRETDTGFTHIHISDIHFGAMNPKFQYDLLTNGFTNKIKDINFDILFLNGDLFHKSYMAESEPVFYAMTFIRDIVDICKSKNASLIILQGTLSHDGNQLRLFNDYTYMDDVDVRIIREASIFTIKGVTITCIPEMYNMGKNYYVPYLNERSHICVVHGMLEDVIPVLKLNSKGLDDRVPLFKTSDFLNKDLVMAGHVHKRIIKDNFVYCGSPYNWSFGDDEPKGFYIVNQKYIDNDYNINFIEIPSPRYIDIDIDNYIISNPKLESLIKIVEEKIIENNPTNNFRICTTMASVNNLSIIQGLKIYFEKSKISSNIKFKINKVDKFSDDVEKFREESDKFGFVLNKNLTPFEALSMYIKVTTDAIISPKEIEDIIKKE